MSSPVWRRRRAGMKLRRIVRDQRRLLRSLGDGRGLSPQLRGLLAGWRQALDEYDAERPRRVRR